MEVSGALPSSVLYAAISLPCALLLLVVGEAGLRVASLALRGEMKAWWPTRAAMLGYRVARPGGIDGGAYPSVLADDDEPPLLPAEYCDRLAVAVYRRGGQGPDPDCAFCLSAVRDGEEVRELRCRHVFHRACLDAWLVRPRATCPLCRDRLLPAESDYDGLSSSSSASASAHGGAIWHMT
jgi:E3 ubiquitin-protein ligase RHA2